MVAVAQPARAAIPVIGRFWCSEKVPEPGRAEDIGPARGDGQAVGGGGRRAGAGNLAAEPDLLGSQAESACRLVHGASPGQHSGEVVRRKAGKAFGAK